MERQLPGISKKKVSSKYLKINSFQNNPLYGDSKI